MIVFLSIRDSIRRAYYAVRPGRGEAFEAPAPLSALEPYSGSTFRNPFVSPTGCAIYFTAELPGGAGGQDIYLVEASP